MKIGIIGKGFVGNAISIGFETQGHEILVHDTKLNTKIEGMQGYKPPKKPRTTFEGNDGKQYDLSWIIKG